MLSLLRLSHGIPEHVTARALVHCLYKRTEDGFNVFDTPLYRAQANRLIGGSANVHNYISSLITKDFFRLYFVYTWVTIGGLECNVTDYVLAKLPNFEPQFWSPDGAGLELVWEEIRRIALQVERAPS